MEGQKKSKLFRAKSLEAIESPEALNDYLRVTSPGVWLIMAAIIVLLIGFILWGILGRIDTKIQVAVASSGGETVCYIPYESYQKIRGGGELTVSDTAYPLKISGESDVVIVSEETNPYLRVVGGLQMGDVLVEVPVDAALADGIVTGTVITERLQPMALLLR